MSAGFWLHPANATKMLLAIMTVRLRFAGGVKMAFILCPYILRTLRRTSGAKRRMVPPVVRLVLCLSSICFGFDGFDRGAHFPEGTTRLRDRRDRNEYAVGILAPIAVRLNLNLAILAWLRTSSSDVTFQGRHANVHWCAALVTTNLADQSNGAWGRRGWLATKPKCSPIAQILRVDQACASQFACVIREVDSPTSDVPTRFSPLTPFQESSGATRPVARLHIAPTLTASSLRLMHRPQIHSESHRASCPFVFQAAALVGATSSRPPC